MNSPAQENRPHVFVLASTREPSPCVCPYDTLSADWVTREQDGIRNIVWQVRVDDNCYRACEQVRKHEPVRSSLYDDILHQ